MIKQRQATCGIAWQCLGDVSFAVNVSRGIISPIVIEGNSPWECCVDTEVRRYDLLLIFVMSILQSIGL